MVTIEEKTETVTQTFFVVTYSRAELEDFVKNPKPYLTDLRAVLNGSNKPPLKSHAKTRGPYKKRAAKYHTPNWATNGNAGHKARGAAVKSTGTAKCEGCGKKFKVQGLGPHKRNCAEYQLKQAAKTAKAKVMSGAE
jgi:hypothetical protein